MSQKAVSAGWWALLRLILAVAYVYPRLLVSFFGYENPWTSFFYLYGFGGIYSGLGILLALKSGACRLDRPRDRFWFTMIIGGLCYFASLHAVWIYLSISIPYIGGQ